MITVWNQSLKDYGLYAGLCGVESFEAAGRLTLGLFFSPLRHRTLAYYNGYETPVLEEVPTQILFILQFFTA